MWLGPQAEEISTAHPVSANCAGSPRGGKRGGTGDAKGIDKQEKAYFFRQGQRAAVTGSPKRRFGGWEYAKSGASE